MDVLGSKGLSQTTRFRVQQDGVKLQMMIFSSRTYLSVSTLLLALGLSFLPAVTALAQNTPPPPASQQKPPDDSAGPDTDTGPMVLKKKKEADDKAPPPAPAAPVEPKVKNPNNETYSIRVDVPIVNLDVNVVLDKTHQFVPGLKPPNFLVLEDGVPQTVTNVRMAQTPITAVMLLEFAANSYYFIRDMQNASYTFFQTLRPDDYIAVITYDLRTHILTDFTNNKQIVGDAISSLTIPGFSDTNLFDALYETLDRISRIEGRKYIILIGTGRDTFSRITLDKILAKVKATPNVTIFTIGTGALVRELVDAQGGMGSIARLDYLQADNQMKTFARMTGGMSLTLSFRGRFRTSSRRSTTRSAISTSSPTVLQITKTMAAIVGFR